jgi:alkanesulfonate monooxygenase SsuD/methylene tetrahydromethanopterin reductase-like flavin-dependent oxidoreductase (luciferase family)
MRAGYLGLPISYGIIGGQPKRFAPLAELYRRAAREAGVPEANIKVSVASPGFVGDDAKAAKDLWLRHWTALMAGLGEIREFAPPSRAQLDHEANRDGALFVGDPAEIAERIVALHRKLGHMRHFFQMDVGHLPQKEFLHAIELLGAKVKPLVDAELRVADSYQETVDVR